MGITNKMPIEGKLANGQDIDYYEKQITQGLHLPLFKVEQISWAIFQGGGLWSTTFVSIYQNVRIGL